MTLTVSVSELRNNISGYLDKVVKGSRVLIRDEKRNIPIAQITQTSAFDKTMYEKVLRKASGIFTAKNHPEWATKKKVIGWIIKDRLAADRTF
jgi:prevent-host-death family protein